MDYKLIRSNRKTVAIQLQKDGSVIVRAPKRQVARQTLQSRVEHFALKLGVQPASLRINGAKGRWGSCSGKNRLNFSWRLMLAPEHCIDYVVVHELCHILHHDHSVAFWQEVERVVPDWRSCRQQLVQTARAPWFWE